MESTRYGTWIVPDVGGLRGMALAGQGVAPDVAYTTSDEPISP